MPQSQPTCELADRNNIYIKDLFSSGFSANQQITIILYGVKIDFYERGSSDPIVVTTQTADGNVIDWVEDGLVMNFDCNSPC